MTAVTAVHALSVTSSLAVAEKPRCRMGPVLGGWWVMAWVRQYSAPNIVSARKLKALIFYTISPLLYEKRSLCVFEPLFGEFRSNVAVHLQLLGQPVVDLLLVIIKLFSLDAMVEALRAIIDWKSPFLKGVGHFGLKFQVEGDVR